MTGGADGARSLGVSVCIVCRNSRRFLEKSLPMVRCQDGFGEVQVLISDNASTDGSAELAADHGARVISVPDGQFHHALTRRRLAEEASGEIVCMLVGDAEPVDGKWLCNLTEPFRQDPLVGATYSRWLARPDAPLLERYSIAKRFLPAGTEAFVPPDDARARAEFRANPYSLMFMSNVSSAYRRELFLRVPFREEIISCEDQFAGLWLLEHGLKIRYCSRSRVWHSHDDPYAVQRQRHRDFIRAFRHFCPVPPLASGSLVSVLAGGLMQSVEAVTASRAGLGQFWKLYRSVVARRMGEYDACRLPADRRSPSWETLA